MGAASRGSTSRRRGFRGVGRARVFEFLDRAALRYAGRAVSLPVADLEWGLHRRRRLVAGAEVGKGGDEGQADGDAEADERLAKAPLGRGAQSSRGQHVYGTHPDVEATTPSKGYSVLGNGSLVVAPPSIHPSGAVYRFLAEPRRIAPITDLTTPDVLQQGPTPPSDNTRSNTNQYRRMEGRAPGRAAPEPAQRSRQEGGPRAGRGRRRGSASRAPSCVRNGTRSSGQRPRGSTAPKRITSSA